MNSVTRKPSLGVGRFSKSMYGLCSVTLPPCRSGSASNASFEPHNQFIVDSLRHRHYHRSSLVLNKEHDELCRLSLAGVPTHKVNVIRALIESLAGRQRHFLTTFHLHDDRTLHQVDERVRIVPMDGIDAARRIL